MKSRGEISANANLTAPSKFASCGVERFAEAMAQSNRSHQSLERAQRSRSMGLRGARSAGNDPR